MKGKLKTIVALGLVITTVVSSFSYAATKRQSDEDYEEWQEEWGDQKIVLSNKRLVLYLEDDRSEREYQLTAEGDPNEEEFKWKSSDEKVATVNSDGVVKARKAGQCTITVTGKESDKTATCTVEVKEDLVPIEEVKVLNEGEVTVLKGKKKKLPFQLLPSNYTTPTIYSSVEESSICSVDRDGNVSGTNEGDTTVTIWFNNVEKTVNEEDDEGSSSSSSRYGDVEADEADFKCVFYVTVNDYDTSGLDDFSKDHKGFSLRNKDEDEQYIWADIDNVGKICYDAEDGKYVKGWVEIGRRKYYLEEVKAAPTSGEYEGKESTFYIVKKGWYKEGDYWYYFNKEDGMMSRGWARDNNKWYYFDKDTGEMKTGMLTLDGKNFWLLDDGSAVELWYNHTDGNTYYGNPGTCELPQGWFLVDGKWYYADPTNFHVLKNQWVQDTDSSWYYVNETGEMLINAQTPDGFTVGADGRWAQ